MQKSLFFALIFLLATPLLVFSQQRTVSGTVRNEKGLPVPQATVQEKGTTNAVTASDNGEFKITVASDNATLVISSVNHEQRELTLSAQASYDVELKESGQLSEVVVTALGITREKKALGYASQEVKAAELNRNLQPN